MLFVACFRALKIACDYVYAQWHLRVLVVVINQHLHRVYVFLCSCQTGTGRKLSKVNDCLDGFRRKRGGIPNVDFAFNYRLCVCLSFRWA